jgi:hypothetical protein
MRVRLLARDYVRPGAPVGSEHDVPEDLAARLMDRGVAEAVDATPRDPPSETPTVDMDELASMTVSELRGWADERGVDLTGATRKQHVLDAIREHYS